MDEITTLLKEILKELKNIDSSLDGIRNGAYDSIECVCNKLSDIEEKLGS